MSAITFDELEVSWDYAGRGGHLFKAVLFGGRRVPRQLPPVLAECEHKHRSTGAAIACGRKGLRMVAAK